MKTLLNNDKNNMMKKITMFWGMIFCWPVMATAEVVMVQTCPLHKVAQASHFTVYANTTALQQAHLAAQLPAQVSEVLIMTGQSVKQGQILAKLESTEWQLNVKKQQARILELQAQQRFALYQVKQARGLKKSRNMSEEKLQQRESVLTRLEAELKQAEHQLQFAKFKLAKTKIIAPFAGVVVARHINVGDWVNQGKMVFEVLAPNQVEIQAKLSQAQTISLQQAINIQLQLGQQMYPLKLQTILPLLDATTRLQTAILTATEQTPLVGSQGQLQWLGQGKRLAFGYLLKRGLNYGFFWDQQGVAKFQAIPNVIVGRAITLPEDFDLQRHIVVTGAHQLTDGMPLSAQVKCPK